MRTIPTDSADVRELAEQADDRCACRRDHDAICDRGWLGEDLEGRPIACTRCRPHLAALRSPRCCPDHPKKVSAQPTGTSVESVTHPHTCPSHDRRTSQ